MSENYFKTLNSWYEHIRLRPAMYIGDTGVRGQILLLDEWIGFLHKIAPERTLSVKQEEGTTLSFQLYPEAMAKFYKILEELDWNEAQLTMNLSPLLVTCTLSENFLCRFEGRAFRLLANEPPGTFTEEEGEEGIWLNLDPEVFRLEKLESAVIASLLQRCALFSVGSTLEWTNSVGECTVFHYPNLKSSFIAQAGSRILSSGIHQFRISRLDIELEADVLFAFNCFSFDQQIITAIETWGVGAHSYLTVSPDSTFVFGFFEGLFGKRRTKLNDAELLEDKIKRAFGSKSITLMIILRYANCSFAGPTKFVVDNPELREIFREETAKYWNSAD